MARRKQRLEILRGDVWLVNFDYPDPHEPPGLSRGSEPMKKRPAVVMNENEVGRLPLHIVVPFTTGRKQFATYPWMVRIPATKTNRLKHDSWADAFQITSTSIVRFSRKLGRLEEVLLSEIVNAVRICVEPD